VTPPVTPTGTRHSTGRELLTVAEFCREVRISRSTFYDWKGTGRAPRCRKLPNGQLRMDRRDVDAWYELQEVAA
jgi:predicted DNA-binding transcriptional regulator AlpA